MPTATKPAQWTRPDEIEAPISIAKTSLSQTRSRIVRLYDRIQATERRTLADAMDLGDLLWQARDMVPAGEWTAWCKNNLPFRVARASMFLRLASFREAIESSGVTTAKDAHLLLDALDARLSKAGRVSAYPQDLKEEALQMRADGVPYRTITAELGVPSGTLNAWMNPDREAEKARIQTDRNRRKKQAEKALQISEREKEIYAAGGPLIGAYRTTARACKQMDVALSTVDSEDRASIASYRAIRSTLGLALDRLTKEILSQKEKESA